MPAEGLGARTDSGGDAHGVRDIDVFALSIRATEPVDGFAGSRLVERILQRTDMDIGPVEVGQMQYCGAGLA